MDSWIQEQTVIHGVLFYTAPSGSVMEVSSTPQYWCPFLLLYLSHLSEVVTLKRGLETQCSSKVSEIPKKQGRLKTEI